jgi:hypothetical protein
MMAKTCISRGGISDVARRRRMSAAADGVPPVAPADVDKPLEVDVLTTGGCCLASRASIKSG